MMGPFPLRWLFVGLAVLGPLLFCPRGPAQPERTYQGKPLAHWVKQLDSPEAKERCEAVQGIGTIGTEAAVPPLLKALEDDETEVREAALGALAQVGRAAKAALPALREAAEDRDLVFRTAAIKALGAIGPEAREAVPAILRELEQSMAKLHRANVVGKAPPAADPAHAWRMSVLEGELFRTVCHALKRIGPDAAPAVPVLVKAVQTLHPSFTQPPLEALGGIGKPALPELRKLLLSRAPVLPVAVAEVLGRMGKEGVPVLIEALESRDNMCRLAALSVIRKMGPEAKPAIPALAGLLGQGEPMGTLAAQTLARLGPESLPFLVKALQKETDAQTRAKATAALKLMGLDDLAAAAAAGDKLIGLEERVRLERALKALGPEAAPALRNALKDRASSVSAGHILAKLGAKAQGVLPTLVEALRHKESPVRQHAALVLGLMGPAARTAGPALAGLLDDSSPEVRAAADDALRKINPDGKKP